MLALLLACTPDPKAGCEVLEATPADDPADLMGSFVIIPAPHHVT